MANPPTAEDHLEQRLDEALKETFPASDPIAVTPLPQGTKVARLGGKEGIPMAMKIAGGGKRVWFVTGASSGFGRAVSEAALQDGDHVVATSRSGDSTLALDVTDAGAVREAVRQALERFGRIDVVFNNAGYGHVGAVEELSDEELRRQLEVNLLGVINVTRAVLPAMREQRSGHLVQMSSLNGVEALPGGAYYTASKFAIKGFSEALAAEVAHLGIKVTVVEPGPFRTRFLEPASARWAAPMPDYAESVGKTRRLLGDMNGKQPGDPARAAQAILRVVRSEDPPLHLPLGHMAYGQIRKTLGAQLAELERTAALGLETDFADERPRADLVREAYSAFNARDVEAGVALMDPEVDWPNVPEGGYVHGRDRVREHWREQFERVDPRIEIAAIAQKDGRVEALVRQVVRGLDGSKLSDDRVLHVFTFAGERIKRMEVGVA
jgi:NAD(P)-dependent dehydrogenase (short-subunit alcohol dehydrogenase family)/ketosteroid isomerase-like protein